MGRAFDEEGIAGEPFEQFRRWWADAEATGQPEPDAVSLATVTPDGNPDVRFVLFKGLDERGWRFYTNFGSAKGRQLAANPAAALAWRWATLERQVRVAGAVEHLPDDVSDAYFASRPRGSQLGAWASRQSAILAGRVALERELDAVTARFADQDVPRPPWWGGYRVVPASVEFWQGRPDRLHDRIRYRRHDGGWGVERLAP